MTRLLAALCLLLAPLASRAAPARLERALGQGLAYVRLRTLPDDLPASTAKTGALVLDLRYARAGEHGTDPLGAWLQFHSSAHTPVLVLVNPGTAAPILDFLENSPALPGLVTLGAPSSRYVPDVPVKVAADADRSAYDALDHGATVDSLLRDPRPKPRHDEASLAQERTAAPDEDDTEPAESSDAPAPAAPAVLDVTLQRAVQLHRTLVALKKI